MVSKFILEKYGEVFMRFVFEILPFIFLDIVLLAVLLAFCLYFFYLIKDEVRKYGKVNYKQNSGQSSSGGGTRSRLPRCVFRVG